MPKVLKKFSWIVIGLICLVPIVVFANTEASLNGGFSASPANPNAINSSRFIYESKKGEIIKDELFIQNNSDTETIFAIYAADRTPPKGDDENEKFTLKLQNEKQEYLGKWMKFDYSKATLAPKESAFIPFTIEVPKDAEYASYEGGIAVEKAKGGNSGNVTIKTRIALRVELKVTDNPQKIEKLIEQIPFIDRINKDHLKLALALFILSAGYLIFAKFKEKH